jgi:hypothetical protein
VNRLPKDKLLAGQKSHCQSLFNNFVTMLNKIYLLFLLFGMFFTSCKVALPPDNSVKKINFNAKIKSITFKDLRSEVAPIGQDIDLPTFSMPNQLKECSPAFISNHENAIRQVIINNLSIDATNEYDFVVEILEAKKIFSASWSAEKEEVKLHLKITISNPSLQVWAEAQGEYFVSSVDAKKERFKNLYVLGLKNVTHKVIEILNKQKIPQK